MLELATLIPVLARPQNVEPLIESWRHSDTPGELWFIATLGDEDETDCLYAIAPELERVNFFLVTPDREGWAKKVNAGVAHVDAEWYLCAADDITFDKGWWDATSDLRNDPTIGVIGTNDSRTGQGNPRVAAGEHTCHPLVRGDYARNLGTFDQPGLIAHPGYHHWFVDDELVWTAKLRNAWAYCPTAVIHHNHPYWSSDVPWDDTYTAGEANQEADANLWRERAKQMGLIS